MSTDESVSSVSTSSSKRRKIESSWEDIIRPIVGIEDSTKTLAISDLSNAVAPLMFSKLGKTAREIFCAGVGLEGWADTLSDRIRSANKEPSNMTWEDVPLVLVGSIAEDGTAITDQVSDLTENEKKQLSEKYKLVDDVVGAKTEGEACCRIVMMLFILFEKVSADQRWKYKVHVQPAVAGHPTITDFLVKVVNGNDNKAILIAVKRFSVYTSLSLPSDETAQVLRGVQLYMLTNGYDSLPFAITNSIHWSFGIAKLEGQKIRVVSRKDYDLSSTPMQSLCAVYSLLSKFVL